MSSWKWIRFLQYNCHWKSPLMENICHKRRTVQEWESTVSPLGILYSWIVANVCLSMALHFDLSYYRPQGKVMFSQVSVILSTIGLMPTRSLLVLVTVRSIRILLECFLVLLESFTQSRRMSKGNSSIQCEFTSISQEALILSKAQLELFTVQFFLAGLRGKT